MYVYRNSQRFWDFLRTTALQISSELSSDSLMTIKLNKSLLLCGYDILSVSTSM